MLLQKGAAASASFIPFNPLTFTLRKHVSFPLSNNKSKVCGSEDPDVEEQQSGGDE